MEECDQYNNKMHSQLIIREGIIFLDSEIQFHSHVNLKLCLDTQIHKFGDFYYNQSRRRWQRKNQLRMPWPQSQQITLEVYYQRNEGKSIVLGEGRIKTSAIMPYLNKQMKIILTYDGLYVGSLYWQVYNTQQQDLSLAKHFLYLHKMEVMMLDDSPHPFVMKVQKNSELVFQKDFHLYQKGKYMFPNIKIPVKMSDVFTVSVQSSHTFIKSVKFLVDSIKRGKTATYDVWLRNKLRVKVGDLRLEYFLQNLYLENERQIFTRNGIFGQSMVNNIRNTLTQLDKQKLRRSVIIKTILEADKRFMKLDKSMHKMTHLSLKKDRTEVKKISAKMQGIKENITTFKPNVHFQHFQ